MKTNIKFTLAVIVLLTSCVILPRQTVAQQSNVSFQLFYDELSPYGEWVDYSNYGYVWIPDVGYDFLPYSTDGRWILTNYGWTWASNYNWGWAAFHYGRWSYNDSFGWFWVPDNEWGPAWVNWRQYNGYYGWQPMQPGFSLNMSFGQQYNSNYDHWMFVHYRDIDRNDIHNYYVSANDRNRIVQNSVVIRNTYVDNSRHTTYVTGPSRTDLQRNTGRKIVPVRIRENNKPGSDMDNGQLRIYRPQVERSNNNNRKPTPARVTKSNDVKQRPSVNEINQNRIGNTDKQPDVVSPQNNTQAVEQRNVNQQNNRESDQQRVNPTEVDNNANRSIQQRTEKQPENKSVEPDKNASRGNSDRSINQNKTPNDNQPKAKQIKRTKTVNKKTDKSESKNRKATLNEKKE